jgi:hypothetical protein
VSALRNFSAIVGFFFVSFLIETEKIADLTAGLAREVGKDITFWEQPVRNLGRT